MDDIFMLVGIDVDSAFQMLAALALLVTTFPRKNAKCKTYVALALTWLLFVVSKALVDVNFDMRGMDSTIRFYMYVVMLFSCSLAFSFWSIQGNRWQLAVMIFVFVNNCVMLTSVGRFVSRYIFNGAVAWGSVIMIFLLVVVAFLYHRITEPIRVKISGIYWLIMFLTLICIMTIWQMAYTFYGQSNNGAFFALQLLFVFLDYAVYFLFMQFAKEMRVQLEMELANQSMALQIRQMDNMEKIYLNTRKERHELKNNYLLIKLLLEQEKYEEIAAQIAEVILPKLSADEVVSTGNKFVNLLLTQKMLEAKAQGIPIVLDVLLSEQISIHQQMLCSLLCNLLDNAIEASVKVAEPDVFVYMREFKGYISIEVRNKIEESVLKHNSRLKTWKKDAANHGIGMNVIRQVVDYCDGNMKIFEENGNFVVSLILPDS